MKPRAVPPATGLTQAQRVLFDSEPGLPTDAAAAVVKAMGESAFRHLSWEVLVQDASVGALEATLTFDPARGLEYRQWAFFGAMHAVMLSARVEHERYAKVRALLRASLLAYFKGAHLGVELGGDTEGSITAKLHGYTNTVVGRAMLEVASMKPTTGGEEELLELEAAAMAGDALREVMPEEGSAERRMLEMHFGEGVPLTKVAEAFGVDEQGYRTYVRRFHEVVGELRAGMEKRGIRERPPWREEVSGRVWEER